MKRNHIIKIFAAAAVSALFAFTITACSGNSEESIPDELTADTGLTGGVAATVNGVEIEEDKVTRAINNMRLSYSYTEDDEWKDYLEKRKYTVESMRYEVVGQFVDQELVKQCAEQRGATTDDAEIQTYVEKVSSQYSSDEAWQKAVDESGWDDLDAYKEALHYSILEKKLKDGFKGEAEKEYSSEAKLVEELSTSATSYSGAKKSSHILFGPDDEELANEVYEKLQNGEISFADAVQEYSTDDTTKEDGGNVGWDRTNSFVTEYTDALANLNVGDISEPVKSKYGYHLITVTDEWTAPETITSSSQIPEEFVTEIKTNAIETQTTTKFDEWLKGIHPSNDIVVNPMPENVPYYVDMSGVYSEEEAAEITEKALNLVITGVEETEEDVTAAEADSDAAAEQEVAGDDAAAQANEEAADVNEAAAEDVANEQAEAGVGENAGDGDAADAQSDAGAEENDGESE